MGWVDPRVGLGREWVENLCFSGLGWVMGLKWQMCEKYMSDYILTLGRDCQPRKLNQLNLFIGVACRPNMTVMLVILWVFCIVTTCIMMTMMT